MMLACLPVLLSTRRVKLQSQAACLAELTIANATLPPSPILTPPLLELSSTATAKLDTIHSLLQVLPNKANLQAGLS